MPKIEYNRDLLLEELRENVIEVTFDKVNGERRVLRCTLREDLLPKPYNMEADNNFHRANNKVIACWDVHSKGWRSFRIESVLYVQNINEQYV